MKSVYIHSAVCISPQNTFESEIFDWNFKKINEKKSEAVHPNYKDYIPASAMRRMATGVKMGVAAATKALQEATITQPDAILTGTGMGCIEDTEKFLNSIITNEEEFLTPTAFIQSTHNTVGAQIALGLKCKSYNNTYVHGAISFESALMDALLLIQKEEAKNVLVGGVDELGSEFVDAVRMLEDQHPQGINVPIGEGASFFGLSSEYKKEAVELVDVATFSKLDIDALSETVTNFLKRYHVDLSEINVLIVGNNGDASDVWYNRLQTLFAPGTVTIPYKGWSGEFYTASAFGLFLGYEILTSQHIPHSFLADKPSDQNIKTILLYNQFKGRDHSFILLKLC